MVIPFQQLIYFTIGTIGSTPEIQLTDGKVSLLRNLEISHIDDAGTPRVTINNPDDNGWIRLSNSGLSRLDATTTGVDVYGMLTTDINGNATCAALTDTSDPKLKENIKEANTKECYKAVKYRARTLMCLLRVSFCMVWLSSPAEMSRPEERVSIEPHLQQLLLTLQRSSFPLAMDNGNEALVDRVERLKRERKEISLTKKQTTKELQRETRRLSRFKKQQSRSSHRRTSQHASNSRRVQWQLQQQKRRQRHDLRLLCLLLLRGNGAAKTDCTAE